MDSTVRSRSQKSSSLFTLTTDSEHGFSLQGMFDDHLGRGGRGRRDLHRAGIVELEGQLSSKELRTLAVRDVWSVPGIWEVYNCIDVGHGLA